MSSLGGRSRTGSWVRPVSRPGSGLVEGEAGLSHRVPLFSPPPPSALPEAEQADVRPQEPHLRLRHGLHHQRHADRRQPDPAQRHGVAAAPGPACMCMARADPAPACPERLPAAPEAGVAPPLHPLGRDTKGLSYTL